MGENTGEWKYWLLFAVALGAVFIAYVKFYPADEMYVVETDVYPEDMRVEPWQSESAPTLKTDLERARDYTELWRVGQYHGVSTLTDNWVRAVQNDPEIFDEASGVFSEILDQVEHSADHLNIMRSYVELIEYHHAAIDQYLNVFDAWLKITGEESQSGLGVHGPEDAFWIFRRAWDASGGDEKLIPKAREYEQYFEVMVEKEDGFNKTHRYTDEYMMQLAHEDGQDPFFCSVLAERLDHLRWLSQVLGHEQKLRTWKMHLADYYMTLHICEDGYPRPEPHRSYDFYQEIGMEEDAREAAWKVVTDSANTFVFGGNPYAPWLDYPEPCDSDTLARLLLWYPRTGLSADEQMAELYDFAQATEEVGYLDAALKIYELLGDEEQFSRLHSLVQKQPRPDEYVALEHFFMRLRAGEPNRHYQRP